jgi:two-component sensor histidine kinase
VQSIAVQTLRSSSAGERQAFVEPLRALAGAHDLVTLESWNRASVRDVVCRVLEAFQEDHRERFVIRGPCDVWLNASKSLLLAMALYELGTNAVKYGVAADRCMTGNCCKGSNSIG